MSEANKISGLKKEIFPDRGIRKEECNRGLPHNISFKGSATGSEGRKEGRKRGSEGEGENRYIEKQCLKPLTPGQCQGSRWERGDLGPCYGGLVYGPFGSPAFSFWRLG